MVNFDLQLLIFSYWMLNERYGVIAQLVERLLSMQEALGSTPSNSIIFTFFTFIILSSNYLHDLFHKSQIFFCVFQIVLCSCCICQFRTVNKKSTLTGNRTQILGFKVRCPHRWTIGVKLIYFTLLLTYTIRSYNY